jgi:hypothetical protein
MYDKSDPRAALVLASPTTQVQTSYKPAHYARFYESEPQEIGPDGRTWFIRGQNAVIVYSDASPGARFERREQIDEWVLILPRPGTRATVTANNEIQEIEGHSITFVPPGDSTVVLNDGGYVLRLYTTRSTDLAERCVNAIAYKTPDGNIPPLQAWPTPPDGYRIRTYSLDVQDDSGRFGRIWRCTTFMVNFLTSQVGPRDATKLSPHHHDDFEQYSIGVQGAFTHHLRWPWGPDMRLWRKDEHEFCGTPSVAVIPPPALHTTRWIDAGVNQLVDVFSPPRRDFSLQNGWVLNAADYPMPPD